MPENNILQRSPQLTEIITAVPKWIYRWGITIVFFLITSLFIFSATISYPDIVRSNIKINSLNAPKGILAHRSGKLTNLFVKDGDYVTQNQIIGFIESIGNPQDILELNKYLDQLKTKFEAGNFSSASAAPTSLNLGEIQESYQNFFKEYLDFQSTIKTGFYANNINSLKNDLSNLKALKSRLDNQKVLQGKESKNSESEFQSYAKLYKNKVISRSEYMAQENKFLSSRYPREQTEISLLNNAVAYNVKVRELAELENKIIEQKLKFQQSLNQCISETSKWINLYVLRAPISGKVIFAGIVQKNQNFQENQEVFIVKSTDSEYFGEVFIPQYNMGKVEVGQKVIIRLYSYPFEQYGVVRGRLEYISEVAIKDSLFIAKIKFEHTENRGRNRKIILKNGMKGDAEIITSNSSLLGRLIRSLKKISSSD